MIHPAQGVLQRFRAAIVFYCLTLSATSFAQNVADQTIGNLSIRGNVASSVLFISGFVVEGRGSTSVLIRGIGPALAQFGVEQPLLRPMLTVYDVRGEPIAQNTGWGNRPSEERDLIQRLGASFPLAENSNDCGLVLTLAPGAYTIQLSGVSGSSGIGLLELYHGNGFGIIPQSQPHLVNISSRCWVGSGEAVAIAGMRLPANRRLLVRAVGPSLTQFGVSSVLANPKLEIIRPPIPSGARGGSPLPALRITSNDDWNTQSPLTLGANPDGSLRPIVGVSWRGSPDEIRDAAQRCGAFPLAEGGKDSAMFVVIDYSPMTVQVSGADGRTGVALVEVYDVEAR